MNFDGSLVAGTVGSHRFKKKQSKFASLPEKCVRLIASFSDMKGTFSLNRACMNLNQLLSNCAPKTESLYNDMDDEIDEKKNGINKKNESELFSELTYKFPNRFQYNHYILLETASNIFKVFKNIKLLHLTIVSPSIYGAANPSNSYLRKSIHKQQSKRSRLSTHSSDQYGDYIIMDQTNVVSRPPITKVETNIYSRAIFNYFEKNFQDIDTLIITFDPCAFAATFITYNIPKILSKISHLYLLQCGSNSHNTEMSLNQSKEGCDILQYCLNLKSLTVNYPLSKEYYPIINNISKNFKFQNILRVEQPHDLFSIISQSRLHKNNNNSNNSMVDDEKNGGARIEEKIAIMTKIKAREMSSLDETGEKQNSVTVNEFGTRLISNVKLQRNLVEYYSPYLTSLHLHGSKGFYSILEESKDDNNQSHKVFFGLKEFCVTVSDNTYDWIVHNLNIVPQLQRLQLILTGKTQIRDLINILSHFNYNQNLDLKYDSNVDNLWNYYYNYYIYYGFNIVNTANKLRHLKIITKNSTNLQNYALFSMFEEWLKHDNSRLTLLHIKLIVKYSFWHLRDLMDIIEVIHSSHVFGKDNMSFQIVMPLIPATKSIEFQNNYEKSGKISKILKKYRESKEARSTKNGLKYHKLDNNANSVINDDGLNQLQTLINEKSVCKMRIEKLDEFVTIVIVEKMRLVSDIDNKNKKAKPNDFKSLDHQHNNLDMGDAATDDLNGNNNNNQEAVMAVKSDCQWISNCHYCHVERN